jgi:type IV pilus assembly protein PilM
VDIGTHAVKLVEVTGSGTNLKVTGLARERTPEGLVVQGVIQDPKSMGQFLKQMIAKNGIRSRKAVVAVGGTAGMVVRVVEVPKMSTGELADTMKWQIEQYIPFAASDVEMAYQKIDDPVADADPNAQMEVLIAVAQRDMVSGHLEALKLAGLEAVIVDVEPLAIGRALLDLSKTGLKSKTTVVINIGASGTEVGIYRDGVLRFPRTIPLGGDAFTRAVADKLSLSLDAAEDEKVERGEVLLDMVDQAQEDLFGSPGDVADNGISSPWDVDISAPLPPSLFGDAAPAAPAEAESVDTNPFEVTPEPVVETPVVPEVVALNATEQRVHDVFMALLPVLGEFTMELRRSVDYFRSKYPTETVDHLLLCGGGANLRGFDAYLEKEIGLPASVADTFASVNVTAKSVAGAQRTALSSSFAVAMGLASRDAVIGS